MPHTPPNVLEGRKGDNLPKPAKDQNLQLISLLSITSKLFEKVLLKIVQKHAEERGLLHASQFDFHACHSTTLQCTSLMEHVTLNFNNNMSMAAVFLDIIKPLILQGTLVCYINNLNRNFCRLIKYTSSIL
jgi:hypothetical protein